MDPASQRLIMGAAGAAGEKIYVEEVFSTYLYTGNGTSQTITNDIDLSGKGGLVWIKPRSAAGSNCIYDTVRGAGKELNSDNSTASVNDITRLSGFTATGFTLGSGASVNTNARTYVSWTFREATKFFDVVTYTGNGVAGRTISHNLGSTPGCIIIKNVSQGFDWLVWHRSATGGLFLNTTGGSNLQPEYFWGNGSVYTAPTSTTFTVGNDGRENTNGDTFVAYVFAHDTGGFGDSGNDNVISCGSYTGNGSTSGPTVTLGWEPQWLLFKRTDTTLVDGWWFIADNMRGVPTGGNTALLGANVANAEFAVTPIVNFNSTGFSFTGTGANYNASGGNYIYIAIRRGPMKTPTDATKVFTSITKTSGSGQINTSDFPVDLSIDEGRNTNYGAAWFDRLRGRGPYLLSSNTNAEGNQDPTYYVGFDSNTGVFNKNYGGLGGGTYVNWLFRRAPGFFDVVAYTGTSVARTVSHNLGVAPELIIVKRRQASSTGWPVYHNGLGAMNVSYLYLNQDFPKAIYGPYTGYFSSNPPTSSVFNLDADTDINASGGTYIAYLFASCPGVSKVGSYTGTGTTQQINCNFTSGARFVLIKRADSAGDWYVWDSARGIIAGNDPYLLLNSTAAEVTGTDYIDTYAAGFEISSTAPAAINANGGSFIYLAIA